MKKYFFFFVIAWFIFVAHAIYTKHAIYGDGNGYYTYTQALFFDKSLNFKPVYNFLLHFQGRTGEFSRLFWDTAFNPYSIGTGIFWLPSMLLMSIFSSNRFSLVYELGPGLTGIICMILGLYFLEKYLASHFSKNTVFWTILTIFFGSNAFYYTTFEPALSHQPAFLIIAILIYLTDKKKVNLFLIGIISGLLATIRIGDTILLIPILFSLRKHGWKLIYLALGAILTYTPQLINQNIQFHNYFQNPYINGQNGTLQPSFANIFSVLFSPKRGFIIWTPLFALGFYQLVKNRYLIICATLLIYLLAVSFWPGGTSAGFGTRLMFSATPYFAIGVAYVFSNLNIQKTIKKFSFFTAYNFLLLYGFYFLGWKNLP